MNELITTGEMIDRLKMGEIARIDSKHIGGIDRIVYDGVKHDEAGNIKWYRIDRGSLSNECLEMNDIVMNYNWRILPNYVSFEMAIQAMKDGKMVYFHPKEGESINAHNDMSLVWLKKVKWRELISGNWTIEGDKQCGRA